MYKDKEYTECTDTDAAALWCPTGVARGRVALERSWQFCNTTWNTCDEASTCKSRRHLELLIDEFLDLSKTNPRVIAEKLASIGCPFQCHYREYMAELLLKKQDSTMSSNRLRLVFEIPTLDTTKNLRKDLDYSIDMFISDLGNGFGFLLGLSLIGIIKIFIGSLTALSRIVSSQSMKNIVLMLYLFLKWTTVATFVTYLSVSSVVMDFSYLASQHQLSSSLFDSDSSSSSSVLLNPEQHKENELVELTWGFSSKLEDKEESLCQFESEVGDGFCDDNINTEICLYDGGDCCRPGAELKPNNHWFCSDCKCHSGAANENVHLKPGSHY